MSQDVLIITIVESVYLLFMYCIFKTSYSFSGAHYEKAVQSLGSAFIHDTGVYENKVCMFGRVMACIAVFLGALRLYFLMTCPACKLGLFVGTIVFDIICICLAYMMNLNAFVYLIPVIIGELFILSKFEIPIVGRLIKANV